MTACYQHMYYFCKEMSKILWYLCKFWSCRYFHVGISYPSSHLPAQLPPHYFPFFFSWILKRLPLNSHFSTLYHLLVIPFTKNSSIYSHLHTYTYTQTQTQIQTKTHTQTQTYTQTQTHSYVDMQTWTGPGLSASGSWNRCDISLHFFRSIIYRSLSVPKFPFCVNWSHDCANIKLLDLIRSKHFCILFISY